MTDPEMDPVLDAFAQRLRRDARPPALPPGLRARSLDSARQEMATVPTSTVLERCVGAVFFSRLFWTSWALALLLTVTLRSPPSPGPGATARSVDAAGLGDAGSWLTSMTSHRPHPTGPLLSEASIEPLPLPELE